MFDQIIPIAEAIQKCSSEVEIAAFLADMLTDSEMQSLQVRWNVALGLARTKAGLDTNSQRAIAEEIGCTQTVVGNVKRHIFGTRSHGVASRIAELIVQTPS